MFRSSAAGRRRRAATLVGLLAVTLLSGLLSVGPDPISHASADTAPPADPTLPTTVSAAVLPTVQINGVVWAQVIVGNTVYATGEFTSARPAGSALGVNETPRSNILAYNLTTGNLITTWAPTLNAQGMAITASADGSTIYVGGDFDMVSGQWRSRVAALDATTGAVKAFNPGANTTVRAFALNPRPTRSTTAASSPRSATATPASPTAPASPQSTPRPARCSPGRRRRTSRSSAWWSTRRAAA